MARLASSTGPTGAEPLDGFGTETKQFDRGGFKLHAKPVGGTSNNPMTGTVKLGEPFGEERKRGHPPEVEGERPPLAHRRRARLIEHINTRRPRTTPRLAAGICDKQDRPVFVTRGQSDVPDMTRPRAGRVLLFWVSCPYKIARPIGRRDQSRLAAWSSRTHSSSQRLA